MPQSLAHYLTIIYPIVSYISLVEVQLIRESLLETLLEMFGQEKKYELEDYLKTLSDEQVKALTENFSSDTTETEAIPEKSDDSTVDKFITTLIKNMNEKSVSTSDQINIIDGTLSAIKDGSLTITNKENE